MAGTAGATYFAGPSPAGNTTLTPTASASFTYTYSATGSGVLIFTGTASSLGQTCTAGTSNGVLVQTQANLTITASVLTPNGLVLGSLLAWW